MVLIHTAAPALGIVDVAFLVFAMDNPWQCCPAQEVVAGCLGTATY